MHAAMMYVSVSINVYFDDKLIMQFCYFFAAKQFSTFWAINV